MPRAKNASECGLDPHWKVRVHLPSGIVHLISRTEPVVLWRYGEPGDQPRGLEIDPILDTEHGDTAGFINWREVIAITWRFAPAAPEPEPEPEPIPAPKRQRYGNSGNRIRAARAIARDF